jgi:hypothetical protein
MISSGLIFNSLSLWYDPDRRRWRRTAAWVRDFSQPRVGSNPESGKFVTCAPKNVHVPSKQLVGGSNPSGRALETVDLQGKIERPLYLITGPVESVVATVALLLLSFPAGYWID